MKSKGCEIVALVVQFARAAEVRLFRVFIQESGQGWLQKHRTIQRPTASFVFGRELENLPEKIQELDLSHLTQK